jgi:hypothetical protein
MRKTILFLGLSAVLLAGCATSSNYINYTNQRFPAKDPYYTVNVYPESQPQGASNPYYVIGKVSVEGFASNGVSPEGLANKAKIIARKRGADAIINAKTEVFHYYGDALLRFKGDLIIYAPAETAK